MTVQFRKAAIGWDRPVTESVVDHLLEITDACRTKLPDFRDFLLIVPTMDAGRLLRETLAERFPNGGVLSLQVTTPEFLLRSGAEEMVSEPEVIRHWLDVLTTIELRHYETLLEGCRKFRNDSAFLIGIAERLQHCRTELADEGLSLPDALERMKTICAQKGSEDRWTGLQRFQEFQALEQEYLKTFEMPEKEPVIRQLNQIRDPDFGSASIRNIIFAACPDPRPGVLTAVENAAVKNPELNAEVWIAAEEDALIYFDAWGRPIPEYWLNQPLKLDDSLIRRYANPAQEAHKLFEFLNDPAYEVSAVGALNLEIPEKLEELTQISGSGISLYYPKTYVLSSCPLCILYQDLLYLRDDSAPYETISRILRDPFFQNSLAEKRIRINDLLKQLDQLQNRHLIQTLSDLKRIGSYQQDPDVRTVVELLSAWNERLSAAETPILEGLCLLVEICRDTETMSFDRNLANQELEMLDHLVKDTAHAVPQNRDLQILLLRTQLQKHQLEPYQTAESPSVDLIGFLELPWRREPHLVIAGFNEESFHYGTTADLFLPDSARTDLGMLNQQFHFAADLYRMRLLSEQRRGNGSLRILYSKANLNGDVLRPARILMQTAPDALPRRVKLLFSGEVDEETPSAPKIDFPKFTPRFQERERTFSVTSFREYLASPFRYYFKFFLNGAGEVEDREIELDNMQFGDIMHKVLETYADRHAALTGEQEIGKACETILNKLVKRQFAHPDQGSLKLQIGIMRTSFQYFGKVQAAEMERGWRIVAKEEKKKFLWSELWDKVFPANPQEEWRSTITLTAKSDRIDRNEITGAWRILDYKTSRTPNSPLSAHCTTSGDEDDDDWKRAFQIGKKTYYWTDLQLPLYLTLLKFGFFANCSPLKTDPVSAGYLNLPMAYSDTGISMFAELESEDAVQQAIRCADDILYRIFIEHRFDEIGKTKSEAIDLLCKRLGRITDEDFDYANLNPITSREEE